MTDTLYLLLMYSKIEAYKVLNNFPQIRGQVGAEIELEPRYFKS